MKCPMLDPCRRRLIQSPVAWAYCELPDELDLMVADLEGFPYVLKEMAA